MGKSSTDGSFSMAMLNNQKVNLKLCIKTNFIPDISIYWILLDIDLIRMEKVQLNSGFLGVFRSQKIVGKNPIAVIHAKGRLKTPEKSLPSGKTKTEVKTPPCVDHFPRETIGIPHLCLFTFGQLLDALCFQLVGVRRMLHATGPCYSRVGLEKWPSLESWSNIR